VAKRTLRPHHQEEIKEKIKSSQLVNFLTQAVLTGEYNGKEVNPVRVQAALGLLRKTVPDLAATDLTATIQDSYTDTLKRIADARKEASPSATILPLVATQSSDSAEEAA
jgi:hypothetical protein